MNCIRCVQAVARTLPVLGARWLATAAPSPAFVYQELFEMAKANIPWRKLTGDHVSVADAAGKKVLQVRTESCVLGRAGRRQAFEERLSAFQHLA